MTDSRSRPTRLTRLPPLVSRPYVFSLERREDPSRPFRAWALVVIELGASSVALRVKGADGGADPRHVRHPLAGGGAERFFAEDLPQLGRVGGEVTRNTPSIYFVLTEIAQQFGARGTAVYRGRGEVSAAYDAAAPDDRIQSVADQEFAARSNDMLPLTDVPGR